MIYFLCYLWIIFIYENATHLSPSACVSLSKEGTRMEVLPLLLSRSSSSMWKRTGNTKTEAKGGLKKKLESFTLTVGIVLKPKTKIYFAASPYQGGFDPNVQNPTLNFFFFWAFPNLIASDIRPDWEHWGQLLTVQIFVMGAAPLTQWLACYSLMLTFVSMASCGL